MSGWCRMMPFRPLVFPHRPAAGNLIRAGEYRQDGTLAVRADLPGTDPGTDVELTVSDGILHIEAERRPQDKPEEKGHLHQEVRYGSSSRSPRLPQGATEAGITATCKDGVLEIRIPEPRHEEAKKKIAISNGVRVSWRTVPAFAAGVLATLAAAVLVLCRGPARADAPATDRIVRWWAAAWLRAAGARVTVHGLERVRADTTYVVVSNHQSNLDPMVHLRALPLSLRILAMRELFRIWLLGRALRAIGMIEVDRASPDLGQIDQAAARCLAAGHSLLVYPEGGTTPDGVIGEFKDGAFVIAVTSQVPVLPVATDGTCRIWPPGRTVIHGGVPGDPSQPKPAWPEPARPEPAELPPVRQPQRPPVPRPPHPEPPPWPPPRPWPEPPEPRPRPAPPPEPEPQPEPGPPEPPPEPRPRPRPLPKPEPEPEPEPGPQPEPPPEPPPGRGRESTPRPEPP